MANYVVLDAGGAVVNTMVWDGVSPWVPVAGCVCQDAAKYLTTRGEDKAKIAIGKVKEMTEVAVLDVGLSKS